MSEVRINRASDEFGVGILELFSSIIESTNFGWANESEIERIEK